MYNDQHQLFSKEEDSFLLNRSKPSRSRLVQHIRLMDYNIQTGFLATLFNSESQKLSHREQLCKARDGRAVTYGNVLYDYCLYR